MGSPQLQPEGAGEGKEAARGEATEKDMTLGVQPRQNRYQNQKLWWRSFLRDSFPGGVEDLEDPTHRGRQNHMDRSMLCRRGLVNLISQEHSWLL